MNEPNDAGRVFPLERLVGRAAADVLDERARQQERDGWTPEHDDEHEDGSMAAAAACYATHGAKTDEDRRKRPGCPRPWPWHWRDWKPKDRRRDLVRAAALLLAEIERVDRQASNAQVHRNDREAGVSGATQG